MKTVENVYSVLARLYGSDTGEFFGASLATGDLNNDGLDDLIIGAPHWGNDNGRVYVYLGSLRVNFCYYTNQRFPFLKRPIFYQN